MDIKPVEEKTKPFRLVKYFTFSSLIVIFAGTIVLSMLNTHWARAMQRQKSEDYALLLLENLNHQVFMQFTIPIVLKYGKIQLRQREQFERLDKVVRTTLHSFKIDMVNIYDLNNVISYSFNNELVGKKNLGGTAYKKALVGEVVSKQIQRGNFLQIVLGIPKKSRIITFAPLRAERPLSRITGPVLGVVEIEQDLSDEYRTIFRFQILVISTSTLVMFVLLLVMIFVVKRGENIIEKRARERLRLKEQLARAEHLSSLGEMVASVSHEIRNPLGIIRSSAELLKKKVTGIDPSNTIPDIIVEESSRLNTIITDFLNYARPKSPELMPCRIKEIVEKNISYLSTQLHEAGCDVELDYDPRLPEIMGDSAMLYQAFLNILINSIQAMHSGGKINIRVTSGADTVSVLFQDRGMGIREDLLDKIWDPFFTTKEKGSGLGLVIVKNIIESHGGRILIGNRSDGGAQVKIDLPVIKGAN